MNFTLKCITPKIKNAIIYSFATGFCMGCFPNKLSINLKNKKFNSIPIPLITGLIGSMAIIFSPLLFMNYWCDSVYFDKLLDKYEINVKRYHQYDGQNNKYAYPSLLIVNIEKTEDKKD